MFEMTEDNCQSWTEVEARINAFEHVAKEQLLIIDGPTLSKILSGNDEDRIKKFFSVATLARSACVCRCSPT
jgi:hypothetical protein